MSNLETLGLFRNRIGDEGALKLAVADNLPNLKILYVGQNSITDVGSISMIESSQFPNLELLVLSLNHLGKNTVKAVFKRNKKNPIQIIYR